MMKKDLWLRLRQYQFADIVPTHLWDRVSEAFGGTDASTRAFAAKIARKHGWSTRFALRAIDEYRKFVFLGVTGDVIVTPSKAIDTVWHEHLLFTRAYREFCHDVLGREFDHNPELLPIADQTATYALQFEATLERYRAEFHVNPPHDIWGTPKFKWKGPPPRTNTVGTSSDTSDLPLYLYFDGHGDTPGHVDMPEFSGDGGGGFSGGGAGSDWGDSASGDSAGGGDSGGDGGGSGCSSGCGGGGD